MHLTYVAVVVLASMIFVLSGMVGYVYWQQTRMLQHIQSLAVVVSTQFVRPPEHQHEHELQPQPEVESDVPALIPDNVVSTLKEDDDRVSVDEKADIVEGPPSSATKDVESAENKTAAQIRDLLTSKGIAFGKRDSKTVLLTLLKASA